MFRVKKIRVCLMAFLIILAGAGSVMRADQPQMAVLLYHHVIPAADNKSFLSNKYVLSRESFAAQMEFLYKNGYHTVSSGELRSFLYEKKPIPPKSVMITFDDGYMSNYMFVYPILKQYGFKAVIFAITGNIQTMDQDYHPDILDMLSWMQVAASSDVFEYGSHTNALHNIANDQTGFMSASMDSARADLLLSQRRIGNKKLFAYPSGQYSAPLTDMIRYNGVDLAFTINKGYINQGSNPLLLNRVTVYSNYDLAAFESIVSCKYRYS